MTPKSQQYQKAWRAAHKERVKDYSTRESRKRYYDANREKLRALAYARYQKNKDTYKQRDRVRTLKDRNAELVKILDRLGVTDPTKRTVFMDIYNGMLELREGSEGIQGKGIE